MERETIKFLVCTVHVFNKISKGIRGKQKSAFIRILEAKMSILYHSRFQKFIQFLPNFKVFNLRVINGFLITISTVIKFKFYIFEKYLF